MSEKLLTWCRLFLCRASVSPQNLKNKIWVYVYLLQVNFDREWLFGWKLSSGNLKMRRWLKNICWALLIRGQIEQTFCVVLLARNGFDTVKIFFIPLRQVRVSTSSTGHGCTISCKISQNFLYFRNSEFRLQSLEAMDSCTSKQNWFLLHLKFTFLVSWTFNNSCDTLNFFIFLDDFGLIVR